mgnify:CR=1 FL=1
MIKPSKFRVLQEPVLAIQVREALLMPCVIPSARVVIIALEERRQELQIMYDQQVEQIRKLTVERDAANNQLNYPEGIQRKITAPLRK